MTAFAGTYSDLKLVKSRGVAQIILEIPIEQFSEFVAHFGGPGFDTWVGIARMSSNPAPSPAPSNWQEEAKNAVRAAALHCKEPAFQRWLLKGAFPRDSPMIAEEMTITELRLALGIHSRAEIGRDPDKLAEWRKLVSRYSDDMQVGAH